MKTSFLVVVLGFSLPPHVSNACPLGAGESTLTLTRVMRNFGRHLMPADKAVRKGISSPTEVTEAEYKESILGLEIVESCADAVIQDNTGALNPRKAAKLEGEEKARYVALVKERMRDFLNTVKTCREIFLDLAAKRIEERNFEAAKLQMKAVEESANRAHEDLQ